jgi:hypothetical protein
MEAIINERKINNIQIESYSWIIKTYHFVNDYKWQDKDWKNECLTNLYQNLLYKTDIDVTFL